MRSNLETIQRHSRRLTLLCTVVLVALPPLYVAYWLAFNHLTPDMTEPALAQLPVDGPLDLGQRLMVLAVTALPVAAMWGGVRALRTLFRRYAEGLVFSAESADCLRRFGFYCVAYAGASILTVPLLSLGLTLGNPPGQRLLSIGLEGSDLTALFLGAIIAVVARVLGEAARLNDDLTGIV